MHKDSYLLELSRYIVLNPVRAGMVAEAEDWRWSSYRNTVGIAGAPDWLTIDWLLSCFAKRRKLAMEKLVQFVSEGKGQASPWGGLRKQIYLGDEAFVEEMQAKVEPDADLSEIPSSQKRKLAKPVEDYFDATLSRNEGIYRAYQSGAYSMKAIADAIGLYYSSVSKVIKTYENSRFKT